MFKQRHAAVGACMLFSPAMLILLQLLLGFMPFAAGQPWPSCGTSSNYTANSTYQINIELLSTALRKNATSTPTLFAKGSVGAVPDIVYGLTLCRGDANVSACDDCIATAPKDAQELCVFNKDTTVFYDLCYLHFSNRNFLGGGFLDNSSVMILSNSQNITEPMLPGWDPGNPESATIITEIIMVLLQDTAKFAVYNSTTRYATGRIDISSSFPTLYSMTQCTPDMPPRDCWDCLQAISNYIMKFLNGRQGGRVLGLRCNLRYEMYEFYQSQPMLHIGWPGPAVPTTNSTLPPPTLAAVSSQKHKTRMSKVLVSTATVIH